MTTLDLESFPPHPDFKRQNTSNIRNTTIPSITAGNAMSSDGSLSLSQTTSSAFQAALPNNSLPADNYLPAFADNDKIWQVAYHCAQQGPSALQQLRDRIMVSYYFNFTRSSHPIHNYNPINPSTCNLA